MFFTPSQFPPEEPLNSQHFEKLLLAVTQEDRYRSEMVAAKQEFEQVAGQIMETDNSYDARINAFHNWYILDRPLTARGLTPLQYFVEYNANSFAPDELEGFRRLGEQIHSVFEVVRLGRGDAIVRDLIQRKKYSLEEISSLAGLERGSIFNTRVFPNGEGREISNYLILHPDSVAKRIKAEAKRVGKAGLDSRAFLFRLLFFQSRWEQYAQMDVKNIYRFDAPENGRKPL